MAEHAILSPSSFDRVLACTPSARFEEQIPEEESGYAAEGTLAHDLAALLLLHGSGQIDVSNQQWYDDVLAIKLNELYSEEMLEHCEAYAKFVLDEAKGAHIYVERRYDMSKYIPLQFGTADASFIKDGVIRVIDFKYGAGMRVMATANKQMMCYGLGAYDAHEKGNTLTAVSMTIYQPRAGGISTWDISVADLLIWANEEAGPKGKLAIAGMGEFVAGKHCQFCKARNVCKAYYNCFAELKGIYDAREMTDDDTATVLTFGPLVASWAKKVEEDVVKRLQNNQPLKGFKLVAGRGRRSFRNEDDVVDILMGEGYESDDIFNPALNSLTAIEKLVGPKKFKEIFKDQIVNLEGKPQIAPVDDDRPAIGVSAADEYDDDYVQHFDNS